MTSCSGKHENARSIKRLEAQVAARTPVGPETQVMTYRAPRLRAPPRPGQFFMLKALMPAFPLFGRAFSVLDYREIGQDAEYDFLVRSIGRGTALLNEAATGSPALLVGPCGNGFPAVDAGRTHLLVGGGTGIAPLYHLMMELARAEHPAAGVVLLQGSRDAPSLYLYDRLSALPFAAAASTEDGSIGLKGMVDLLLQRRLDALPKPEEARIFTCGPNPMMRAVAHIGEARGITTYLSLETRMACGTGICNGCALPVEAEIGGAAVVAYLRACWDGPVFRSTRLPEFRLAGTPSPVPSAPAAEPSQGARKRV